MTLKLHLGNPLYTPVNVRERRKIEPTTARTITGPEWPLTSIVVAPVNWPPLAPEPRPNRPREPQRKRNGETWNTFRGIYARLKRWAWWCQYEHSARRIKTRQLRPAEVNVLLGFIYGPTRDWR